MGEISKVIKGATSPLAWLTSGRAPVDPRLADKRAFICASCPKNGDGPLTGWFTEPAAKAIGEAIEERHKLKMETHYDESLGTCTACFCVLVVKVWEPLDIALKHLPAEARKDLWENCWMKTEESQKLP